MRALVILSVHVIATLARLLGPGGIRSLVAGTVLVRQQLLILNRSRQRSPNLLSSDHHPLFRFHQRQANLRVLEVEEIKTVPYPPLSHPFVERLIGTLRRECLDRTLFWTTADLESKLLDFKHCHNGHRAHGGIYGLRSPAVFRSYHWQKHCRGLYQTPITA